MWKRGHKRLLTILMFLTIAIIVCSGCSNNRQNNANTKENNYFNDYKLDYDISDITSEVTQDHIKFTIEDDLQEAFPGYNVDYVESVYISQEYIEELYYNSLGNVYFGYDYDEVAEAMQGVNWTFTVDENGQTVVTEVLEAKSELQSIIKKVAVGAGVIVVCAVVSAVSGGAGAAPIACFFAGAAKGALLGAVSGAAISGVIGGAITGVKTKNWDAALNSGLSSAADGFMWGAISGALVGGFTSTSCFTSDTLVKTMNGFKPISRINIGEYVYSYNEQQQNYSYNPVSRIYKKTTNEIITIAVNGEKITTTPTHPFYTVDGWVEAKKLTTNTYLLTEDGYSKIDSVNFVKLKEDIWVYNMTVAKNHTYTVSLEEVVVHNACGDSAKLRKNLISDGDLVPDYPNAAHHIIPSSDARYAQAAQAREKLLSFGIDINDASNGVFLSTSKNVVGTTYHGSIHTAAYYEKVNSLLSTATTKKEALDVLAYIKTALLKGTFI